MTANETSNTNLADGWCDFITGTCSDAYSILIEWNSLGYNKKTILVENTHATYDMNVKVLCYTYDNQTPYEQVPEMTLTSGDILRVTLNKAWSQVVVWGKNRVAGQNCTWNLDFTGHR